MKFILFVEGPTEQKVLPAFIKRWLDPQLAHPVGVKVVKFEGWADYLKDIVKKVRMHVDGPEGDDILGAIGLLDLYGPTVYPPNVTTVEDRLTWFTADIERKVNRQKFRQFFAVHELEAWILADPELLPRPVANALPGSVINPEIVNNTQPPAKLLEALYDEKAKAVYKKVTNGSELFSKLDPHKVHAKCPNFRAIANYMLATAKQAGL